MNTPRAPGGLGGAGRKVWREINAEWSLTAAELTLLREVARATDRLDHLDGLARDAQAAGDDEAWQAAVREARLLAGALTRMITALKLPDGRDEVEEWHAEGTSRRSR